MGKRSFWPYAFKCLLLAGVAGGLGGYLFYRQFEVNLQALLEEESLRVARLATSLLGARAVGEGADLVREARALAALSDSRVTVIGLDGQVLADSESEPSAMENHGHRPEVEESLQRGFGHAIRRSATLGTDMLYTAVREDDIRGAPLRVVRLARSMSRIKNLTLSFSELVWTSIPLVVLLGVLAFYLLIEVRISRSQSPS